MNRDFIRGAAAGLGVGVVLAILAFQAGRAGRVLEAPAPVVAAPAAPAPAAPGGGVAAPPAGGAMTLDASQQIETARRVVEQDPKNRQAWVVLGNLYFDAHQPQKSVEAYARALELKSDDPDVLTDQGVMYRALGDPQKAIANFERAGKLEPNHLQSRFNLGVVYAFDLKDTTRAEQIWNALIQSAPGSEQAGLARQALAQLKGGPAVNPPGP